MLFETSRKSSCPAWRQEDVDAVLPEIAKVLRSGVLILGKHTAALEREFADFVGTKYAVALSSCTAALEIALTEALGAVVMPSNSFVAAAAAAETVGTDVVFCEIGEDFCLDVEHAISLIEARDDVTAVVVTHLAGFVPHGFDELLARCDELDIVVIEDCSHAHGATHKGSPVGGWGDFGCFSFYATKIMSCGVGGMLTTNSEPMAKLAREVRHHGAAGGRDLADIQTHGSDYLMDEVRAVLCLRRLKTLGDSLLCRREVAAAYATALRYTPVVPIPIAPESEPAYYKYPVLLPESYPAARRVRQKMATKGFELGTLYDPPIHRQKAYADGTHLPRTDALLARQVCLPMHNEVYPDDCRQIVDALVECLE